VHQRRKLSLVSSSGRVEIGVEKIKGEERRFFYALTIAL
jgi:hypothetical protein